MTSSFVSTSTSSTANSRATKRRLGLQEEHEVRKPSLIQRLISEEGMMVEEEVLEDSSSNDESKANESEPTSTATSTSIGPQMESEAESVDVPPTMAEAANVLNQPTSTTMVAEEDGVKPPAITSTTSDKMEVTKGNSNQSDPETASTINYNDKTDEINVDTTADTENKDEQEEEEETYAHAEKSKLPAKTRTSPKQILSIASPYGEVTAIQVDPSPSTTANGAADIGGLRTDTSNMTGQQKQHHETNITPTNNSNLPSKTRTSPMQLLSIASPYGEVSAFQTAPPTSSTAGHSDIGGNGTNKAGPVVALVRSTPQRAPPPRVYMASPYDFVDDGYDNNNNNNNNSAATNNDNIRHGDNRIGAFRVGIDGGGDSSELLNGGGRGSVGTRQSASNKSTTTAVAVEISAELAPTNHDVEALVEERIRERERELAVAEVAPITNGGEQDDEEEAKGVFRIKRKHLVGMMLFVIIAIVSAALIVSFLNNKNDDNRGDVLDETMDQDDDDNNDSTQPQPEIPSGPTLDQVKERGFLRCGVDEFAIGFSFHNTTTDEDNGFLIDICRALALAVLDDPEKVEVVYVTSVNRFKLLRDREIDVLAQLATITMSRDIFQELTFSAPFHHTGLAFAGDPIYVDCADRLDSFSDHCHDLKLCIQEGTTHELILDEIFEGPGRVLAPELRDSVANLENGLCNVVAQDSVAISEPLLRVLGYTGPYQLGSNLFSKEPLALATHDRDPEWSKIVNMVINTLYAAESLGITQETTDSELSELLEVVEDRHLASLFVDVVSTIGNMGELYQSHLEDVFPRQGLNLLNDGDTGLIYSFPFGNVEMAGELVDGGMIESILARQKLRCGVSQKPGFAEFNATSSAWSGLDIEFCVAVSAAIFFRGARDYVEFIDVTNATDRLEFLANGEIDVLAGERVTLQSLWLDPGTAAGYSFSAPYFYGNTGEDGSNDNDSCALATLRNDTQWSDFVYWVTMSTFFAEENGIGKASSISMPIVGLFGESVKQMFRDVIFQVGNYGDIYNRTIGTIHPRSGRNMLNLGNTPLLHGFPLV